MRGMPASRRREAGLWASGLLLASVRLPAIPYAGCGDVIGASRLARGASFTNSHQKSLFFTFRFRITPARQDGFSQHMKRFVSNGDRATEEWLDKLSRRRDEGRQENHVWRAIECGSIACYQPFFYRLCYPLRAITAAKN
jgi:hypothetical protein